MSKHMLYISTLLDVIYFINFIKFKIDSFSQFFQISYRLEYGYCIEYRIIFFESTADR